MAKARGRARISTVLVCILALLQASLAHATAQPVSQAAPAPVKAQPKAVAKAPLILLPARPRPFHLAAGLFAPTRTVVTPVNHGPASTTTNATSKSATAATANLATQLASASVQLHAATPAGLSPLPTSHAASPWSALHDELTRLSIASDQTHAAAGHVLAVGASVSARTRAHKPSVAEIALEQASRRRLLALIDKVQQSNQNVDRALADNQALIERHHFSPRIEARQHAAVSRFDSSAAALAAVQQKLVAASNHSNADAWHDSLTQLQKLVAAWQPASPAQSPQNTPWATPHLKVRAPHLDADDYLQHLSLFDIKPIELAYAGNQPVPAGTLFPILPTLGEAVLAGDTQATIDASQTPAIQAEAAALKHNPALIYQYVHDRIAYVPYYGSLQGADFTLQSGRGNDMDSASLLIALLRASNIPARYVYGTVQVPTINARNWLGGVPDASAALSLLAQGGVPSQAVTNGSQITAIQLEHVWVEAYVDYVPSRGLVQQQSDTWIPLDPSYKQSTFTAALNVPAAVPFSAQNLLSQLTTSATVNANGQIQNLNSASVQSAISAYQQSISTWLGNYPSPTAGSVLGQTRITPNAVPQLPSVLPYTLNVAAGDFDGLPASWRWQWRLKLFANSADQTNSAAQVSLTGDVVTLLGHRLTLGFRPSSADDSAVLASFLPTGSSGNPALPAQYPGSLPAYLINMTPQLFEDGQLIADAGASVTSSPNGSSITTPASPASQTGFPLGTPLLLDSAAYDPGSQNWQSDDISTTDGSPLWTEAGSDTVNAGETHVVSLDTGMSPGILASGQAALDALAQQLSAGNQGSSFDSETGLLLQAIGQNYFGLLDAYEQWMESGQSLVGFRRLSWARIASEVDAQYTQGLILSASFPGAQIRLDHLESAIVGQGGAAASIPYRLAATERLSLYSQTALQTSLQSILPTGNPVSAVNALATALSQGQALDLLNTATYPSLSPNLSLSAQEQPPVTNAVAAGQAVLLNPVPVSLSTAGIITSGSTSSSANQTTSPDAWTGRGLLYQDPSTGNSRFTVSNGATALWYDAQGTSWFAFAGPGQLQTLALPALTATRNLNVQLQTALGNNQNLPWAQFTPANDLINGDLLSQLNAQTSGAGSSNSQNLQSASPNLLPTAAAILATATALSQSVNLNLDAPPQISSTPQTTGSVNVPYQYAIQASSPQGKALSYSLASGPSAISITGSGSSATLSWATPLQGSWPLTLRVSDGSTFTTQSWTLTVSQGAPVLQMSLNVGPQPFAAAGSSLTVQISTEGGQLPETATLTVDGQPVALTPFPTNGNLNAQGSQSSTYTATLTASPTVGNHNIVAQVSDGNQTVTQTSLYATNDPQDNNISPTVAITAPSADGDITSPVTITGSVSDPDLAYYLVLIQPVGAQSGQWTQVGTGTQNVTNGPLATLDPSTLQNGLYNLSLVAYNSQGQQTGIQQGLEIEKNLKLGQFQLTFNDISLTAPGGMPLQLTRTYDSTRSTQALDFGYGWSSSTQNVSLKKNVPTGYNWTVTTNAQAFQVCLVPQGVHKVTITLPDGSLYNFSTTNAQQCQTGATPLPSVVFQALDNTATLTVNNPPVLDAQGGNLLDTDGNVWDPTGFTLTLQNQTQYILDQNLGLQQIKDKFGNTLTFTTAGIQSSDGQGITFQRDSSNRITQATDESGNSLQYAYDQNGNLATVTDRNGNQSTFTYLQQSQSVTGSANSSNGSTTNVAGLVPVQAHYLESYTTPNGVIATRLAYNDQGQLIGSTNAQGQSTTITYNENSNQQTVKDKLGNITTYTYDNNGNIVQKVDALGNTWNYTFDANGNQTSQIDPLGHTTTTTYGLDLTNPGTYDQVMQTADALGNTISMQYNANGNPAAVVDANGNNTGFEYFGNGSLNVNESLGVIFKDRLDNNGNEVEVGIQGQTTLFTFDSNGYIVNSTDPVGTTTSYTNDSNGNPLSSRYNLNLNIGLPSASTAAVMTQGTYDANGNVLTSMDALGNVTRYTYDANNDQLTMTDPQGHVTQYIYDVNYNLIETIYPDGTSNSSTYDANNNKLTDTDQNGHVTSYAYDAVGNLTQTTNPDGSSNNTSYDAAGNVLATTNVRGQGMTYTNDADGRAIAVTNANSHANTYTFGANGNQLTSTTPDGQTTSFQYDALNRLTQTTLPNGQTRTVTYNQDGTKATETDENGNTTSYNYDLASKLTGVMLAGPNGNVITNYGYDQASNEASQTDGNGHATRWQFDVNGNMTGRTLPDNRQETFAYDSIGNLLQHIAFDGTTLYVSYDAMARPILKAWPDGRQSRYTYTPTGNVATVTLGTTAPTISGFQPSGTTTWTYDANDRINSVTYPSGQYINYAYDNVGNLISRATADGSWSYGYDANQNLTSVTDTNGLTTQYSYDVNNRLSTTTYPDGTTGYREYDANGHLLQIAWKNGKGVLLNGTVYALLPNGQRQTLTRYDGSSPLNIVSLSYTNPATGAVSSQTHWGLSNPAAKFTYIYDYAERLTQEQLQDDRNNTERITNWVYDAVGNRLSQTVTTSPASGASSTVTTTYTYDVTDRLQSTQTTDATGTTTTTNYSWDQNGRLIQKATPSQITQYSWRSDDRLIQVQQGATTATLQTIASYQYDDNGNRTQRTTYVQDPNNPKGPLVPQVTNYLIDESYPYAETLEETQSTNAGQTTRTLYTWDDSNELIGANQNTGATTGPTQSYYEQDGLGSVITLSDPNGNVLQNYKYGAFGLTYNATTTDTNAYRYTGEYADTAIGLQYNRQRWYDSAVARFTGMDAYAGILTQPQTLHRYLYVGGDAVNSIDPSGLQTEEDEVVEEDVDEELEQEATVSVMQSAGERIFLAIACEVVVDSAVDIAEQIGYLYVFFNKAGKPYVGQTSRAAEIRVAEHELEKDVGNVVYKIPVKALPKSNAAEMIRLAEQWLIEKINGGRFVKNGANLITNKINSIGLRSSLLKKLSKVVPVCK